MCPAIRRGTCDSKLNRCVPEIFALLNQEGQVWYSIERYQESRDPGTRGLRSAPRLPLGREESWIELLKDTALSIPGQTF